MDCDGGVKAAGFAGGGAVTQTRRPLDRSSVVRRTAVLAAAVLVSMGAQGAIQRAGPPSAARTEAPVVPADGVIATTGDAVVSGTAVNAAFDPAAVDLSLSLVGSGFSNPVLVTNAGDGSGRLFVVEQTGRVKVIKSGSVLAKPFLDLHAIISTGGERGLLGLAFHPRYPTVPYVYVNFTTPSGATAITRYKV